MKLAETYPKAVICSALNVARGRFYYQAEQNDDETALKAIIAQTATEWVRYGERRLCKQLEREGVKIGRVKMARLMKELGIAAHAKKRKIRTTNSDHSFQRYPNLVQELSIIRPHQLWVGDITYIRLWDEFIYLAVLMDIYTRAIVGWSLSRSIDQDLTLAALHNAFEHYGVPEIHHTDQGVQYAATAYIKALTDKQTIAISMAEVGCPEQNGYAERLMRTIKEEHVDLFEYRNFADAVANIGRFLDDVYMKKRIHSSLGYLTPVEFAEQYANNNPELFRPIT
jgi:putative transposase